MIGGGKTTIVSFREGGKGISTVTGSRGGGIGGKGGIYGSDTSLVELVPVVSVVFMSGGGSPSAMLLSSTILILDKDFVSICAGSAEDPAFSNSSLFDR